MSDGAITRSSADVVPETAVDSVPTPVHLLYMIGLLTALAAFISIFAISAGDIELGPLEPVIIGILVASFVSAFVPALVAHAIVGAIRSRRP